VAERARGALLRIVRGATLVGGEGLMAASGADLQIYGRLCLGRNVKLGAGCLLSVGPDAELEIGDDCFVGRNTVIAAAKSIRIESKVDIAEHCTIRDSDHDLTTAGRVDGASLRDSVLIGRGSWLGAGVRILRGSHLGPGVVVGANAVVRGRFEAETLIAGVPARVIRSLAGRGEARAEGFRTNTSK
jgi:serine acetyltransferase